MPVLGLLLLDIKRVSILESYPGDAAMRFRGSNAAFLRRKASSIEGEEPGKTEA